MLEQVNKFLIHQADVQHPKLTQSMHSSQKIGALVISDLVKQITIKQAGSRPSRYRALLWWEAAGKNKQVLFLFVPLLLFAAHGKSQEAKPEEEGEGWVA